MDAVPAALGLSTDQVAGLLATAGRAPSLHNSQPWRFRVLPDVIELWADPARRLVAADPTGREQRLACGAALYNVRLGLHGHGIRPLVTLHVDPERPDLLATVRYGGRKPPTPEQSALLAAIPRRHTNRRPFSDEPVSPAERGALRRAAIEEGAWLHFVDGPDERLALAQLAAEAHAAQLVDPRYLAEAERWTAVSNSRDDGVPAAPNEHRPSAHERWVKRDFTGGRGPTTAQVGIGFEQDPAIAVLSPHLFGASTELGTGQAMQRVLLTATVDGLSVSFLSHVIEVERARDGLRRLIRSVHSPLVVMRIGHGWPVPATPRRAATDLLMPTASDLTT